MPSSGDPARAATPDPVEPAPVRCAEPSSPRLFVETRGHARAAGYRFLGRAPDPRWWQRYRAHTSFEQPTLIVESTGRQWQAYLGGIPSDRLDAVGTVIHYAVMMSGRCGLGQQDSQALALIGCWLTEIVSGVSFGRTRQVLDRSFPAADVERLLGSDDQPAAWAEVQRRGTAALAALPAPDPLDDDRIAAEQWIGKLRAPDCRAAFLNRVAELLTGRPGRALAPNLVDAPDEVDDLLTEADSPVVILVSDDTGSLGEAPVELHPKAGRPATAADRAPRPLPTPNPTPPSAAASSAAASSASSASVAARLVPIVLVALALVVLALTLAVTGIR